MTAKKCRYAKWFTTDPPYTASRSPQSTAAVQIIYQLILETIISSFADGGKAHDHGIQSSRSRLGGPHCWE
jgi:hypothetical protein